MGLYQIVGYDFGPLHLPKANFNPILRLRPGTILETIPQSIKIIFTPISTEANDLLMQGTSHHRSCNSPSRSHRLSTIAVGTFLQIATPDTQDRYSTDFQGIRPSFSWSVKFLSRLVTRMTSSIISSSTSIFERHLAQQRPANLINVKSFS